MSAPCGVCEGVSALVGRRLLCAACAGDAAEVVRLRAENEAQAAEIARLTKEAELQRGTADNMRTQRDDSRALKDDAEAEVVLLIADVGASYIRGRGLLDKWRDKCVEMETEIARLTAALEGAREAMDLVVRDRQVGFAHDYLRRINEALAGGPGEPAYPPPPAHALSECCDAKVVTTSAGAWVCGRCIGADGDGPGAFEDEMGEGGGS